jgi:hypothetical protein
LNEKDDYAETSNLTSGTNVNTKENTTAGHLVWSNFAFRLIVITLIFCLYLWSRRL